MSEKEIHLIIRTKKQTIFFFLQYEQIYEDLSHMYVKETHILLSQYQVYLT